MAGIPALLGIGLSLDGVPQAINTGISKGQGQADNQINQQINRESAYQKKQLMDYRLAQAGRADALAQVTQPDTISALQSQLQAETVKNQDLSNKMLKNDTYTALNNYFDSNGDPRSLNTFLQDHNSNPVVKSMFGKVVRIEPLDLNNPSDLQTLQQNGITKDMLDAADGKKDGVIDWKKLKTRYVKTINSDGTTGIADMLHISAATGYARYTSDQNLAKLKELSIINKNNGSGNSNDTTMQKNATAIAEAKARIQAGNPKPGDAELIQLGDHQIGGVAAGQNDMVQQARKQWVASGFDNLSQDQLQNNTEARDLVNQIEMQHPLSPKTQQELIQLRSLVALSSEAGHLSSKQTGIWDRFTNDITGYVDNNVHDKVAKASYGAFINVFRHNLFGSALTEGELKAFKDAYGSLGQKIGPVLAGLRAAMVQVKSQLQTISDLNDPIVVKFHTGKTMKQINQALDHVDQRIKFYDAVANGESPDKAANQVGLTAPNSSTDKPTGSSSMSVDEVSKRLGL